MRIFNYVIQVSDYGTNRLINISIKADTIVNANMAIMIDIVNANYRNHDSNQYSLHFPRLISIEEIHTVACQEGYKNGLNCSCSFQWDNKE